MTINDGTSNLKKCNKINYNYNNRNNNRLNKNK
jgi:hypothetical protein